VVLTLGPYQLFRKKAKTSDETPAADGSSSATDPARTRGTETKIKWAVRVAVVLDPGCVLFVLGVEVRLFAGANAKDLVVSFKPFRNVTANCHPARVQLGTHEVLKREHGVSMLPFTQVLARGTPSRWLCAIPFVEEPGPRFGSVVAAVLDVPYVVVLAEDHNADAAGAGASASATGPFASSDDSREAYVRNLAIFAAKLEDGLGPGLY
jgi:hypothetical protein